MENRKTISEIAKLLNLEISTIRYYEKEKLIIPGRDSRGQRVYDEEKILQLKYIIFLKKMHLSIFEIRDIIRYFDIGYTAEVIYKIKDLIFEKQKNVDFQLENLVKMKETLMKISEVLEKSDSELIEKEVDQIILQEVDG